MRDINLYLNDILDAVNQIETYTEGMSLKTFKKDRKTLDAVVRNLEVIGEACRHVPEHIKESQIEVDWKESIAMRNILIHQYFGVDVNIIWDTIQTDIPKIKTDIKKVTEKIQGLKM